jgi:hypothetical protein
MNFERREICHLVTLQTGMAASVKYKHGNCGAATGNRNF